MAPRDWCADAAAGPIVCSEERLRACLDTLVENAVRYTSRGQTIRVFARREQGYVVLGVSDGGSGLSQDRVAAINHPDELDPAGPLPTDARSRTGLGLSLVREVVESRGGGLAAGTGPEGGAMVTLHLPYVAPAARTAPGGGPRRHGRSAPAGSDDAPARAGRPLRTSWSETAEIPGTGEAAGSVSRAELPPGVLR